MVMFQCSILLSVCFVFYSGITLFIIKAVGCQILIFVSENIEREKMNLRHKMISSFSDYLHFITRIIIISEISMFCCFCFYYLSEYYYLLPKGKNNCSGYTYSLKRLVFN